MNSGAKNKKMLLWSVVALGLSLSVYSLILAFDEAYSVVKNNSKDFNLEQMEQGDLTFARSAHSRNAMLLKCFDSMNSILARFSDEELNNIRRTECYEKAEQILEHTPSMSMAWIIKAEQHFASGDVENALESIIISSDLGKNESWLAKARIRTILKFANGLDLEEVNVFKTDLALLLSNRQQTLWLASQWKKDEDIRPAVEIALSNVPKNEQLRFIRIVRNM